MRKFFLTFLFTVLLFCDTSFANTFYVRSDGGTSTQCNGLSDKPYTTVISDVSHDCAVNHPFWVLSPQGNNPTKMVGGDTLIVAPGEYQIGLGAPNTSDTSLCYSAWPWGCNFRPVPSGSDATHPTRILGQGWDTGCTIKPKFWGTERVERVLNLDGSNNIEIQCLDITDKSNCIENGPDLATKCKRDAPPFGQWAANGIHAQDSNNVLIKNVDIHGLVRGVLAGRLSNWTLDNVNIIANSFVGWDGDIGATTSSNSGNIIFKNSKIQWSGCGQNLDGTPHHCYSQDQGGYGDALGTNKTGGNWIFDHVEMSNNVSDGLDLLYHNGQGSIKILFSKFADNAGNQVKIAAGTTIDQTEMIGGCDSFKGKPYTATTNTSFVSTAFNNCRAGGDVSVFAMQPSMKVAITNSKYTNVQGIAIGTSGSLCNGTEVISIDSATTFDLKPMYFRPTQISPIYYASGATGNGDGPCASLKLTTVTGTTPPPCVSNGTCNGTVPCGTTGTGIDNCGNSCSLTGPACTTACPVCPPQTVCAAPVLTGVTTTITSNGKTYNLTK